MNASAVARHAPRPTPARKRSTVNCVTFWATEMPRVNSEKMAIEEISVTLRPNRSVMGPDREGPETDADQSHGGGHGQGRGGEAQVAALRQRRDDGAQDDQVEPVECDGDPTQQHRPET